MTASVHIERPEHDATGYEVEVVFREGTKEYKRGRLKPGQSLRDLHVWQGREIVIREVKRGK